ncbi:MAG TPA: hypothetical protein VLW65_16675 [Bryobacteraceae bacterium]|nr:hypothetical protein [Bryobacteraceae bacterium]
MNRIGKVKTRFGVALERRADKMAVGALLPALLALGLVGAATPVGAQTSPSGVALIQPGDAQFRALLDANFPGFADSPSFAQMQPLLALLVNSDSLSKTAYSVRWSIGHSDGWVDHMDKLSLPRPFAAHAPTIRPGQVRLLSPFFSLSPADYRRMGNVESLFPASIFAQSGAVSKVSAALDGVVSEDGTFFGQDDTSLRTRYACFARAEHDEGVLLANSLQTSPSAGEILAALDRQIADGLAAGGKLDAASLHTYYVGQVAQTVRNFVQQNGTTGLNGRAAALTYANRYAQADCASAQAQLSSVK